MRNALLIFAREVRDQLRDKRTLFMLIVLPLLLYPALALGMIQMQTLFNEKPRNVVVLGADQLPETSPLIPLESDDGTRFQFDPAYFDAPTDADKLRVIADAEFGSRTAIEVVGDPETPPAVRMRAMQVETARDVTRELAELEKLAERIRPLRRRLVQLANGDETAEPLTAAETDELAGLDLAADALTGKVSNLLATADIQALIIIPDGFAETLAAFNRQIADRTAAPSEPVERPQPRIVQNTADEKSTAAMSRVRRAMEQWEKRLLAERLAEAQLPSALVEPVAAASVDVARTEERVANVWARLFPFLLVLMSVTGAFYPAIDLGAGEKERGTMETLLICPATRGQIVAGKFFTIFLFSLIATILNILSMGLTGAYLADLVSGSIGGIGGLETPPLTSLLWVLLLAIPMAAMFSALSLALAMFARSSKEGQYYLTPLVSVTIGLAIFASFPLVAISPFYSVMPVVGPALLLKGLLSPGLSGGLTWYLVPVLISSVGYSILALWWARDQFDREDILFREADRFELGLWLRQLVTKRGETPTFAEAGVLFGILLFLQLAALRVFRPFFDASTADVLKVVVLQQTMMFALPAALFGFLLTANIRKTFLLHAPKWPLLAAGLLLPLLLHPVSIEVGAFLGEHFFEEPPAHIVRAAEVIKASEVPVLVAIAVFALTPAICEELTFRGFLLTGLATNRRWTLAIVLSALAFGLVHWYPPQVFNAALLGLVLGLIAVRSGSLLPGVAFHLIYNSIEVLRSRVTASSVPLPDALVWAGEDGGVRYGWLTLGVCGIAAAALILWLVRQPVSSRFARAATVIEPPPEPAALAA